MNNRSLEVGRAFWQRTGADRFAKMLDLELRTEPEPFLTAKPHRGRIPLSLETAGSLGSAEPLHQERTGSHFSPLVKLTVLLHYALGLIRYEYGSVRPVHRGAPSARCLYATELFFVPADAGLLGEEGAYRYDPLMHALERRACERVWPEMESALGRSLDGAEGALVLGADFWRIARLYADFAYNIGALEAGHVIAQLKVLAARLGYSASVHERFFDHELIERLGMNGSVETPLAVVVLWPLGTRTERFLQKGACASAKRDASQLPARFERELGQCVDLQRMMEASRLTAADELPAEACAAPELPGMPVAQSIPLAICIQGGRPPELLDAIRTRNSGNDRIGLAAAGRPIPYAELSGLLRELAAHPDARELAEEIGIGLAAHRVEGLEAGIYWCDLTAPALHPVRLQEDVGRWMELASMSDYKVVNFRSLPASFYLTADFERMLQQHGNRGYQILLMKVGRLAQYICLLAAARGWFARPLKSYHDAQSEAMLGLQDTPHAVVYQVVIGENKTPYLEFDMGL